MTAIFYFQIKSYKVFGPMLPSMVHLGESNLRPFRKSFSGTQNQPKVTLIYFFYRRAEWKIRWVLLQIFLFKRTQETNVRQQQAKFCVCRLILSRDQSMFSSTFNVGFLHLLYHVKNSASLIFSQNRCSKRCSFLTYKGYYHRMACQIAVILKIYLGIRNY